MLMGGLGGFTFDFPAGGRIREIGGLTMPDDESAFFSHGLKREVLFGNLEGHGIFVPIPPKFLSEQSGKAKFRRRFLAADLSSMSGKTKF